MTVVHLVPGAEAAYAEVAELGPHQAGGHWPYRGTPPRYGDWVIGVLVPQRLVMDRSRETTLRRGVYDGWWDDIRHLLPLETVLRRAGLRPLRLPARLEDAEADAFVKALDELEAMDEGQLEGHIRSRSARERSDRNRAWVRTRSTGVCPCCGQDVGALLNGRGRRALEVHHLRPLGRCEGPIFTRVADLAAVCATCHRLLHAGANGRLLHPDELRVHIDPKATVRCPRCGSDAIVCRQRQHRSCDDCDNQWIERSRRRAARS